MARAAALALAVGLGAGGVWYGRHGADRAHPTVAALPASLPASLPATVPATPTAAVTPATEVPSHAGGANVARLRLATIDGADEAPVVVTFALRRPGAHRVALVGDFDEWSPTAVPMSRAADGTWTASVRLTPGRHAYAFVVDDHAWATDPKAPLVRDPDYGRDQSIVVVGQP
jgi:hypothetical protein